MCVCVRACACVMCMTLRTWHWNLKRYRDKALHTHTHIQNIHRNNTPTRPHSHKSLHTKFHLEINTIRMADRDRDEKKEKKRQIFKKIEGRKKKKEENWWHEKLFRKFKIKGKRISYLKFSWFFIMIGIIKILTISMCIKDN